MGLVMARTTIALDQATRDKLRRLGRKGETYDAILRRLIEAYTGRAVEFEQL